MKVLLFRKCTEEYKRFFDCLIEENIELVDVVTSEDISNLYLGIEDDVLDFGSVNTKGISISEFDQIWLLGVPTVPVTFELPDSDADFAVVEWNAMFLSFLYAFGKKIKGLRPLPYLGRSMLGGISSKSILENAGWKTEPIKRQMNFHDHRCKKAPFSVIITEKEWWLIDGEFIYFEKGKEFEKLCWSTWSELRCWSGLWVTLKFFEDNDNFVAIDITNELPIERKDIKRIVRSVLY